VYLINESFVICDFRLLLLYSFEISNQLESQIIFSSVVSYLRYLS